MKPLAFLILLLFNTVCWAYKAEFPTIPEPELTPGSLCTHPSEYRYKERIAYCKRNVSGNLKADIFQDYRLAGYRLTPKERANYKIDHYIPLCAGGSNDPENLWPQHISVYTHTDPIEHIGCEKLMAGRIKQAKLVKLILLAKNDLTKAEQVLSLLHSL